MIVGIGIDIIIVDRVINLNNCYKKKFIKRILNKNEKKDNKYLDKFLSKNFAIKESVVKALGIGFRYGISFNNIIIKKNLLNKPFIKKNNTDTKLLISLSHEKHVTIAITVILSLIKIN